MHPLRFPALTSTNTIVGTLQVGELLNEGTLTVNGTIEGDMTNAGTLTMKGTVTGDLVNAGELLPGASPGILAVSGTFTQTAGGALRIELSRAGSTPVTNPVAGVDYDQLQLTGPAYLAGALSLKAGETLAVRPLEALPFLTAAGGVTGAFEALALEEMLPPALWSLHYGTQAVSVRFNAAIYLPLALKSWSGAAMGR